MKKGRTKSVKENLKEFYQLDGETIKDWRECLNEELMESYGFTIESPELLDLIASDMWKITSIPPEFEGEAKAEFDRLPSEEKEFWLHLTQHENSDLNIDKDIQLIEEMALGRWYLYTKKIKKL